MTSTKNRVAAGIAVLAIGAGSATAGYVARGHDADPSSSAAATTTDSSAQPAASNSSLSVNDVYRLARTGVVEVISTQSGGSSPFPQGQQESQAQGSGFVYDTQGHIVTNEHVVDGASSVSVRLFDGRTLSAQVVGVDASTDLAVLRVANLPSNVTPLKLGSSDDLEVGDGVVAIGSPFGLEETVTSGIVSALNREIQSPNNFPIAGAIQTDAAINHGNSGGPLLDLTGRVVGVNSQIESDSGGNDGVGFAIPSSTVKSIAARLIADGKVAHAFLGVSISDGTATAGARVESLSSSSPAARAGIEAADVITALDGKSIDSASALRRAIDSHAPGDKVKVTVRRAGTTKTFEVTLGNRPATSS